jgi:ankyrin repeat protein
MLFLDSGGFEKEELSLSFDVDEVGNSLLHLAVHNGDKIMVQVLLSARGITNTCRNSFGQNVVHIATQRGSTQIVKLLLKNGLYCNSDLRGLHPLHFAALNNDMAMMEVLVDVIGDKINDSEDKKANEEEKKRLIAETINKSQQDGFTPVHYCCHKGSLKLLKYLISVGGDLKLASKKGVTCLHLASASGKTAIVEFLLKEKSLGFFVKLRTMASKSLPVHVAAKGG